MPGRGPGPSQLVSLPPWQGDGGVAGESDGERSLAWLVGEPLPSLELQRGAGRDVDLATLGAGMAVLFSYPGVDTRRARPQDPDGLLGTGCTRQVGAFREHALDFAARRVDVYGISGRPAGEQQMFAEREHLPFSLLSDPGLALGRELGLPTREDRAGGRVYEPLGLCVARGVIEWVFHPVSIPRRLALDVLGWLSEYQGGF